MVDSTPARFQSMPANDVKGSIYLLIFVKCLLMMRKGMYLFVDSLFVNRIASSCSNPTSR